MAITYVRRTGHLFFSGYSRYIQKVEKNKNKYYNKIKRIKKLPQYCGIKVDVRY